MTNIIPAIKFTITTFFTHFFFKLISRIMIVGQEVMERIGLHSVEGQQPRKAVLAQICMRVFFIRSVSDTIFLIPFSFRDGPQFDKHCLAACCLLISIKAFLQKLWFYFARNCSIPSLQTVRYFYAIGQLDRPHSYLKVYVAHVKVKRLFLCRTIIRSMFLIPIHYIACRHSSIQNTHRLATDVPASVLLIP
jgi:hypothetical protein